MNVLSHILEHALLFKHVILIDDARCFTGEGGAERGAAGRRGVRLR